MPVPSSAAAAAVASASALARDVGRLAVMAPTPRHPTPASVAPAPSLPTPAAAGAGSQAEPQALVLPAAASVSSKSMTPPVHPGFGTEGQRMIIRANHFLIGFVDKDICHSDVAINPEPKTRRINRIVMSELTNNHRASLGGQLIAYTAGELPFKVMDFSIKLRKEWRETEYKVTIQYAARANLYRLQQFLSGKQRDSPQDTIQALGVVLRESPSLNYITVARSFFSTTFVRFNIGDGLECWRGYYQSLRPLKWASH